MDIPQTTPEQVAAMLSAVLRSKTSVRISMQIIKAFVAMRKLMSGEVRVKLEQQEAGI